MGLFEIIAVLVTLAALFSFINHRYVRLPTTIGVMAISLFLSLALVLLGRLGLGLEEQARAILGAVDFEETLLHGMLGFLLFAGALHVDINDLARQKWIVGSLATVGVLVSTLLVGGMIHLILAWLGIEMPFIYCLIFGALISPTDPIAVLGIMKTAGAPRSLETKVTGESLFNDGVGVVVFLVIVALVKGTHGVSFGSISLLLLQEAVGGILLGLVLGLLAYWMLRQVDNYQVEVLLTLALVTGGYALADAIHTSGPIAMVVAGLLVGNHGRTLAMSETTRAHLDTFWELVDEILNAILFVLLGLEVLIMPFSPWLLLAGVLAIPAVLLARGVSVGGAVAVLRLRQEFTRGAVRILTWGGLRGGISVALALSLPPGPERQVLLAVTYVVVVFSILVQGLTIGPLVRRLLPPSAS
jgi:CPA1 family monovalent cation:H+ antiporter